jgi:hypothetical protein
MKQETSKKQGRSKEEAKEEARTKQEITQKQGRIKEEKKEETRRKSQHFIFIPLSPRVVESRCDADGTIDHLHQRGIQHRDQSIRHIYSEELS